MCVCVSKLGDLPKTPGRREIDRNPSVPLSKYVHTHTLTQRERERSTKKEREKHMKLAIRTAQELHA